MRLDHGETECELRVKARSSTKALLRRMKEHHDYAVPAPRNIPKPDLQPEPVVIPIAEPHPEALPVEVAVLPIPEPKLTIDAIKRVVCRHYGISHTDIVSDHRHHKVVRPRQVAIYLARKLTPRSYPEIGRKFGGRDWTTCIHAVNRVGMLIASNAEMAKDVASLEEFLTS